LIFREVRDPRDFNARHELPAILFIALAATLCGAKSCVAIADFAATYVELLKEIVDFPHGAPSHDCFSRVFRLLDPEETLQALTRFVAALREGLGLGPAKGVVAIDGKRMRRGYERGRACLHAAAQIAPVSHPLRSDSKNEMISATSSSCPTYPSICCPSPYVPRGAFQGDPVCVTQKEANQVTTDNNNAAAGTSYSSNYTDKTFYNGYTPVPSVPNGIAPASRVFSIAKPIWAITCACRRAKRPRS
jgi:DDE_Tnp_1-associated